MDCNKPDFDLFIYNSNNLNNPNDSTNKNYKYNYTCTDVETMNCTTHNTQWNDGGQGNVIFLDRHNIKCPPNKGLKQMQLKRNSTDLSKYRYDYTCCDINDKKGPEEYIQLNYNAQINTNTLQPLSNNQTMQPLSNNQLGQPLSNNQTMQPLSNNQLGQPLSNNQLGQSLSNNN